MPAIGLHGCVSPLLLLFVFFCREGEEKNTYGQGGNMEITEQDRKVLDELYELWDRSEQEFFEMEERKILDEPKLDDEQQDQVRRMRRARRVGDQDEWPDFFARNTLPTLSTTTIWELLHFFLSNPYKRTHADIDRLRQEDTWLQGFYWKNKLDTYFGERPEWKQRDDLHHCFGCMALKLKVFVLCYCSDFVE